MWTRTCFAIVVCLGLAVHSIAPAKALLVDGGYKITLTGSSIDPSSGSFDVVGGSIQNFTLDLLRNGAPANAVSTYSTAPVLFNVPVGSMLAGVVHNDFYFGSDNDRLLFLPNGSWVCAFSSGMLCATSSGNLWAGKHGKYDIEHVAETPLPAAAWLFLSALAGLGLIARRRRRAAA